MIQVKLLRLAFGWVHLTKIRPFHHFEKYLPLFPEAKRDFPNLTVPASQTFESDDFLLLTCFTKNDRKIHQPANMHRLCLLPDNQVRLGILSLLNCVLLSCRQWTPACDSGKNWNRWCTWLIVAELWSQPVLVSETVSPLFDSSTMFSF